MTSNRRILVALGLALVFVLPLAVVAYRAARAGLTWSQAVQQMFMSEAPPASEVTPLSGSMLPKGAKIDFLKPQRIGQAMDPDEHPQVAQVSAIDLDRDGLVDVLACDVIRNRVVWIRQFPRGTYVEQPIGDSIAAPAHAEAFDIDNDGDLDVLVASLGVLLPSNAQIGAVIILENDGRSGFTNHVIVDKVARVSDVRGGDLDGDGDFDLAVAQFGYNDGETRWMENVGRWQFQSHVLQNLSGPINVEIADMDKDGDGDIVSLVSQEWEEVYVFVNDGHGRFQARRIFGSSNEDFGSSWITIVDLDRDGDSDVLYSNGDAFDYTPATGRTWHGVQWLENKGGLVFEFHRIASFPGACSPQPADIDGDGDTDVAVVSAYNDWRDPAAQSFIWLENNGRMQFTAHDITSNPSHLITLATGDFDADGRPDFVTGGMHITPPYDRTSRVTLWTSTVPR